MRTITKHSGRIQVKQGRQAIIDAAHTYQAVWQSACKHDGIAPDSKFIVFSDSNPFLQFLAPAMREYQSRMAEYQAGGYVGLQIS